MGPNVSLALVVALSSAFLTLMCESQSTDTSCTSTYPGSSSCSFELKKSSPLRVFYLDKQYVTQNQAAIAKAASLGMNYTFANTCESHSTALPEWYATET